MDLIKFHVMLASTSSTKCFVHTSRANFLFMRLLFCGTSEVSKLAKMLLCIVLLSAKQYITSSSHVADDKIDVVRVSKCEENKQARDKHVLGLLTSLRAVFPGNVTENIGRQILPYAKYNVVPDELQLKQPTKEKQKVRYEKKKVQFDKKFTSSRKHQASFQRH